MLVLIVIEVILPSLGHHLPIGLSEISSLLPPSKDIPFLTGVSAVESCRRHERSPGTPQSSSVFGILGVSSLHEAADGLLPQRPHSHDGEY